MIQSFCMKKITLFFVISTVCFNAFADDFDMDAALRATYENCIGIDGALHDMKVKAGISTVVTGVGTGLGIGATAVGIAKSKTDDILEQKFKTLDVLSYGANPEVETVSSEDFLVDLDRSLDDVQIDYEVDTNKGDTPKEDDEQTRQLKEKSKRLGRWRTGLLVGNTATNIAGAAISGTNKVQQSLKDQIQNCVSAVKNLHNAIMQAKINNEDVTEAVQIESACKEFEYVDIEKINNMATGGMVSSVVGTGTGVAGIITSALANSDNVRKDDSDQGKKKEKNLNTAANVLSAGSTVASATATIFNASQIKAIKDVAKVAEQCTEALK